MPPRTAHDSPCTIHNRAGDSRISGARPWLTRRIKSSRSARYRHRRLCSTSRALLSHVLYLFFHMSRSLLTGLILLSLPTLVPPSSLPCSIIQAFFGLFLEVTSLGPGTCCAGRRSDGNDPHCDPAASDLGQAFDVTPHALTSFYFNFQLFENTSYLASSQCSHLYLRR